MIISNALFTSLGVNEGSLLTILVDFKKLSVIFDLDTLLFESFLNESISRITIMNELVVSIHDSEAVDRGKRTVRLSPSPDFVGNEEIETFDFTSVGIFGNTEETVTTLEVGDVLSIFMLTSSPGIRILAGIDGVFRVFESFI